MAKRVNFSKLIKMPAWKWEDLLRDFGCIIVTLGRRQKEIAVITSPKKRTDEQK